MNQKNLVRLLLGFNLVVGNFILVYFGLSHLLTSFIAGNDTLVPQTILHILCSIIAVGLLLGIVHLVRSKTRMSFTVATLALVSSLCVPFAASYLLFVGYAVFRVRFDMIAPALFVAMASTLQSKAFWVPMGLVNSAILIVYNAREGKIKPANQAW